MASKKSAAPPPKNMPFAHHFGGQAMPGNLMNLSQNPLAGIMDDYMDLERKIEYSVKFYKLD